MGIPFHKKPYLSQYEVDKKLDIQDFLWPETVYLTYEIIHVILTSLNKRGKKTPKKFCQKYYQKELQAIISTMFNCSPSNISATVE